VAVQKREATAQNRARSLCSHPRSLCNHPLSIIRKKADRGGDNFLFSPGAMQQGTNISLSGKKKSRVRGGGVVGSVGGGGGTVDGGSHEGTNPRAMPKAGEFWNHFFVGCLKEAQTKSAGKNRCSMR